MIESVIYITVTDSDGIQFEFLSSDEDYLYHAVQLFVEVDNVEYVFEGDIRHLPEFCRQHHVDYSEVAYYPAVIDDSKILLNRDI